MSTHWTNPTADHPGVPFLPLFPRATSRTDDGRRPPALVLTARRARDRAPTATCWRLHAYDPATGVPIADLGGRWEPATLTPATTTPATATPATATPVTATPVTATPVTATPVTARVLDWLTDTLRQPVTIAGPADPLAGPCSWYVTTPPRPAPPPASRHRPTPPTHGAHA